MEDTFTFLAVLSRSWALVAMMAAFIVVILWAFRPGSRAVHRDTADIPFRYEDKPAPPAEAEDRARKEARS